jgi:Ribonucleotide reductase, beta subunit
MLDTISSPIERYAILYQWKTDEHLFRRYTFIGECYNGISGIIICPEAFMRVLMANYILEGIYFYSGFKFLYNVSRNGKIARFCAGDPLYQSGCKYPSVAVQ